MENFFFIDAALLVAFGVALLVSRIRFLNNAQTLPGQVIAKVGKNYSAELAGGLSKHLLIGYQTPTGEAREYICDNAMLSFLYREGQPVTMIIEDDRIAIRCFVYLVSAPVFLILMGSVILAGFGISI